MNTKSLISRHVGIALLGLALTACLHHPIPGSVSTSLPTNPDPEAHYLIYIHGRIIESQGIPAISPEHGTYEYNGILEVFSDAGLQVISEVRTKDVVPSTYANALASQVQTLLDAGVPANHITIIGFSKGGIIAILTSAIMQNIKLQFVIQASCSEELFFDKSISIAGRLLSIYEVGDSIASSCQPLFDRATSGSDSTEIVLDTGWGHGEFYKPHERWVEPVLTWIMEGN